MVSLMIIFEDLNKYFALKCDNNYNQAAVDDIIQIELSFSLY